MSRRRAIGNRRGRARRHTAEVIDLDTIADPVAHIDLTMSPEPVVTGGIVDLTNTQESPVIITSQRRQGRVRGRGRGRGRSTAARTYEEQRAEDAAHSVSDDSDDSDLPDLPFELDTTPPKQQRRDENAGPSGVSNVPLSPGSQGIICPICFDNDSKIKSSGRRILSTICGHLFCNDCLHAAVDAQHRCPTCRKKLTRKNIHPIFI